MPMAAIPAMANDPATDCTEFLDFRFSRCPRTDVIRQIEARPGDAHFAYVVTPNVDHVVRIQRNRSDLWPVYRHAWMTLCDSRILGWLAIINGLSLSILSGSDLTAALFREIVKPDDRIAVLGGAPASVRKLSDRFGLANVAHYNPPMGFIHDPAEVAKAVAFIVESHARFTFIAVGSPQQECIARAVENHASATGIGLCIGASLDFLTGDQTRAPRLVQKLSLEWMFRLLSNPARMWRRYLVEGPQILLVVQYWRRARAHG
nr:WecB/TagA/CpsF family glycosyltransferase [Hephaestia sp. MAHUQ-44]